MKNFNGLLCENFLSQLKKGKKKKKDRDHTISAVTNIHTRFYIQIREYPSTRILAAALPRNQQNTLESILIRSRIAIREVTHKFRKTGASQNVP